MKLDWKPQDFKSQDENEGGYGDFHYADISEFSFGVCGSAKHGGYTWFEDNNLLSESEEVYPTKEKAMEAAEKYIEGVAREILRKLE
jgi:hypothetical protein